MVGYFDSFPLCNLVPNVLGREGETEKIQSVPSASCDRIRLTYRCTMHAAYIDNYYCNFNVVIAN